MPCSTCNHSMTSLGTVPNYWHCPRCGTLKAAAAPEDALCPALVDRVRDLYREMVQKGQFTSLDRATWHRLGITEAAWPPEGRPVP